MPKSANIIVRAAIGKKHHEQLKLTEDYHKNLMPDVEWRYYYELTAPYGYGPTWVKVFKLLQACNESSDGTIVVWIDGDAVILKAFNLNTMLPEGFDVAYRHSTDFYNSGVVVVRNSLKVRKALEQVIKNGPLPQCPTREEISMHFVFKRQLRIANLASKFNDFKSKYCKLTCNETIIKAFHTKGTEAANRGLIKCMNHVEAAIPI